MRAAIYSRFSTDKQDRTSIERQVHNCKLLAKQHGFEIVAQFKDEGISGNDRSRPGYQQLREALKRKAIDIVLADETSRLSRDPGELHNLVAEMEFNQQHLVTRDGVDSREESADILIAVKTASDKLESRKIATRTYGSLRERVEKGYSAGGRPYGYTLVEADGYKKLVVDPACAKVVIQIFEARAEGMSERNIASDLNAAGVASPGKPRKRINGNGMRTDGMWMHTTIRAMLRNPVYRGTIIWNKYKWIKKPGSSQRQKRLRPESEWITTERPELRIVPEELWKRASAVIDRTAKRTAAQRAKGKNSGGRQYTRLLSGLLKCGGCGYNYTLANRYDYACSSHRSGGSHACANGIFLKRKVAEDRILAAVKEELLSETMLEKARKHMQRYLAELKREAATCPDDTELDEIGVKIANITEAIVNGGLKSSPALGAELQRLEARAAMLRARRTVNTLDTLPDIIPQTAERYRAEIERMAELERPRDVVRARTALKTLLGDIRLEPQPDGHLIAHLALKNSMFSMLDNGGSGGRI